MCALLFQPFQFFQRAVLQKRVFELFRTRPRSQLASQRLPLQQIPSVRRLDFDHRSADSRRGVVSSGERSDAAAGHPVLEQRPSAVDFVLLLPSIRAACPRQDRTLPPVPLPAPAAQDVIFRFLRRTPPDPGTERLRRT